MSKAGDLRKLSAQPMTQEHNQAMLDQAFGEKNDRGACLLFASNLENALDAVLSSWCGLSDKDADFVFQSDGIFGTFSRKIYSARALRIIGPITHENLSIIRHVRNAFAHAKLPINFQTCRNTFHNRVVSMRVTEAVPDNHEFGGWSRQHLPKLFVVPRQDRVQADAHGFLTTHDEDALSAVRLYPVHRSMKLYIRLRAVTKSCERRAGLHNCEFVLPCAAGSKRLHELHAG